MNRLYYTRRISLRPRGEKALSPEFSRTLSLLRQEKGVSQRKAAGALGISQALLSHYENGIREPGLAFVVKASPVVVVCCLNADQLFKCVPAFLEVNYGNWVRKLTRE